MDASGGKPAAVSSVLLSDGRRRVIVLIDRRSRSLALLRCASLSPLSPPPVAPFSLLAPPDTIDEDVKYILENDPRRAEGATAQRRLATSL